jgi:hypothetical protein
VNRDEKIRYLAALEEIRRRRRMAPLKFYKPHGVQEKFHESLKKFRGTILSGGNRLGKTHGNGAEIVAHWYGYRIWEVPDLTLNSDGDYPARERIPARYWIRRADGVPLRSRRQGLVVSGLSLEKGVGAILWPKLEAFLPPRLLQSPQFTVRRGPMGVPVKLVHPGGHELRLGSDQQGPFSFEGAAHDFVGVDEPVSQGVWQAIWRGCIDFFAPFWFTFTPIGDNAPWIYREFFTHKRDDVNVIMGAQDDNPHLTKEARKAFFSGLSMNDEAISARRYGRFGFLSHRAFPTWNSEVHVIKPFRIPRFWPRVHGCDPANRRPFFFVWLAYDPIRDTWICYREDPVEKFIHMRASDRTVLDYSTMLRLREGTEKIARRRIDPRFGVAQYTIKGQKNLSTIDDFGQYGVYYEPAPIEPIETGVVEIRNRLWYNQEYPISDQNRPRFLVTEECQNVIEAFENWSFVPPNARDENVLLEKVQEPFKDPIDSIRYAIAGGPPAQDFPGGFFSERDLERENNFGLNDL